MTTKPETPETKSLIAEYEAIVDKVREEIAEEAKQAMEHLNKATALCEQHGVSYYFSISPIRQSYVPDSFKDSKFQEIKGELLDLELLEYSEYSDGRAHSAVC